MTVAGKKNSSPDGSLSTHNGFSLISNEKLLQIYLTMLKCRMLEEHLGSLGKRGRSQATATVSPVHIAAIAGAAIDLLADDTLSPSHGALAPCFTKGMSLRAIFASIKRGRSAIRPSYAALNLIPPSLSTGKQLERVLKVAAGYKAKRNKKVAIVFCSSASGESSELERAMIQAGKKKLPIVFVCQTGPEDDNVLRVHHYGFPGVSVEDDDAVAVYRVATEAIAHARRGSGPTLIECKPWPLSRKRSGKMKNAADPVRKMEIYLTGKGLFTRKLRSQAMKNFRSELDAAVKDAAK